MSAWRNYDVCLLVFSPLLWYSVFIWRHQILKSKTKESLKVLSSSGIRGTKFISVYNFPAQ